MIYLISIPLISILAFKFFELPKMKNDDFVMGVIKPWIYGMIIITSVWLIAIYITISINNSVEYQRALHDPRYGVDREVAKERGMCSNIFSRPFCNKEMAALKTSRELKSENK